MNYKKIIFKIIILFAIISNDIVLADEPYRCEENLIENSLKFKNNEIKEQINILMPKINKDYSQNKLIEINFRIKKLLDSWYKKDKYLLYYLIYKIDSIIDKENKSKKYKEFICWIENKWSLGNNLSKKMIKWIDISKFSNLNQDDAEYMVNTSYDVLSKVRLKDKTTGKYDFQPYSEQEIKERIDTAMSYMNDNNYKIPKHYTDSWQYLTPLKSKINLFSHPEYFEDLSTSKYLSWDDIMGDLATKQEWINGGSTKSLRGDAWMFNPKYFYHNSWELKPGSKLYKEYMDFQWKSPDYAKEQWFDNTMIMPLTWGRYITSDDADGHGSSSFPSMNQNDLRWEDWRTTERVDVILWKYDNEKLYKDTKWENFFKWGLYEWTKIRKHYVEDMDFKELLDYTIKQEWLEDVYRWKVSWSKNKVKKSIPHQVEERRMVDTLGDKLGKLNLSETEYEEQFYPDYVKIQEKLNKKYNYTWKKLVNKQYSLQAKMPWDTEWKNVWFGVADGQTPRLRTSGTNITWTWNPTAGLFANLQWLTFSRGMMKWEIEDFSMIKGE